MRYFVNSTWSRLGRARSLFALAAMGLALGGCKEDLLNVQDPENATPGSLTDPASIPTLVAGAIRDFNTGYSGGGLTDRTLSVTALITDEFFSAGTFTTRTATDQRVQQDPALNNTSDAAYNELHDARVAAMNAATQIADLLGTSDPQYSLMKAIEGYTYVILAENFCEPLPFGDGFTQTNGTPISTTQAFEEGVTRLDDAIANAGGSATNANLAAVGKGRALVNLGRYAEAAAAVAGVPTDFIYFIEHSAASADQQNAIFNLQSNGRYSVGDFEGGNGLGFRSAADPRVPWTEDPNGGFDSTIRLFLSNRHNDRPVFVPASDGVEARLIEAEAQLASGDVTGWLATLNALRADVFNLMSARWTNYSNFVPGPNNPTTTLDPLVDPGTVDGRVDLMFSERAFWLFNTGHRLADMRRLIRDYGRAAETVFPTGAYHKGGSYGPDVVFPLTFEEVNNPNYNPASCNTQQA